MIEVTEESRVMCRAGKIRCLRFPQPEDARIRDGLSLHFQEFDQLKFLAETTQHIPKKDRHLIHYLGWFSNKERGMCKKMQDSRW